MRFSLRTRLLASYLLLLTITLGGITLALFLLLGTRPEPRSETYTKLSTLAQGLNLRDLVQNYVQEVLPSRPGAADAVISSEELLANYAENSNVRVLALVVDQGRLIVEYDSSSIFDIGQNIVLRVDDSYNNPELQSILSPRTEQVYGWFSDPDGSEWLFGALTAFGPRGNGAIWMLADTRSSQTLQQTLTEFGATLLLPIVQAGFVGLLIAVVLAALISRTIAHPLQAVSKAATAIARGDLQQRIPVTGPPEVRSVAEAFNQMSAEVRDTQQAQRDFLANVSHDLKTPLTSIQGYSQAIMDGTAKDPAHAAEIIHDEAGRLNRMVIELTDLARIQAGRLSMQAAAIDMSQLVNTVTRRLAVMAQNKGIALNVDAPKMPDIAGDGDRLVQVIDNLVGNAIKYTPNGGSVFVQTRSDHSGVEVIVQDSGVGIPERDLPRVFERFYQVDKTRGPSRGTGLGLAITYEIVRAHGGNITVNSVINHGTTFTVWFPSPHLSTVVRGRT